VLILGSSRVRDDLVPAVLAGRLERLWQRPAKVYNLGLGGANLEEVYTLACSYIPDPPPPYVIIGFSGTEAAGTHQFQHAPRFLWRFENFINYLRRVPLSDLHVVYLEYYLESLVSDFWYLFSYRDALCTMIKEKTKEWLGFERDPREIRAQEEATERLRAHIESEDGYGQILAMRKDLGARLADSPQFVKIQNERELVMDEDVLNGTGALLIRLIVEKLREKGCKVVVVETPPSPYLIEINPVLHGPGFRDWMTGIARELNVPFFAFPPEKCGLTNDLFADASHLSEKGARRYTRLVYEELQRDHFFGETRR
ncbi:MAG: hypothetical protein KJ645_05060, partial [Planctomycetes bacterium]|nr:hypothetical protein [Planctomycetota bacterium]